MQDTGCIPGVRVFRWPGSVFGARCPALGVGPDQVPGIRFQVPGGQYLTPGTRYRVPVFEKPVHQDRADGEDRVPSRRNRPAHCGKGETAETIPYGRGNEALNHLQSMGIGKLPQAWTSRMARFQSSSEGG